MPVSPEMDVHLSLDHLLDQTLRTTAAVFRYINKIAAPRLESAGQSLSFQILDPDWAVLSSCLQYPKVFRRTAKTMSNLFKELGRPGRFTILLGVHIIAWHQNIMPISQHHSVNLT